LHDNQFYREFTIKLASNADLYKSALFARFPLTGKTAKMLVGVLPQTSVPRRWRGTDRPLRGRRVLADAVKYGKHQKLKTKLFVKIRST
jgi:hypothetical protein